MQQCLGGIFALVSLRRWLALICALLLWLIVCEVPFRQCSFVLFVLYEPLFIVFHFSFLFWDLFGFVLFFVVVCCFLVQF
jgi:hypothetical protein